MQWTTMDPLAEKYYGVSPYAYCEDSSIKLTDSNGKQPGDPLSTGVPAQQQSNGTWTMAQASSYVPTHRILETKTIPSEDRLKTMLPASSGTITATETHLQETLDATADNPMTQLETGPVIQGVAVGALTIMGGEGLTALGTSEAATTVVGQILLKTTQVALANPEVAQIVGGVTTGIVLGVTIPTQMQNVPQLNVSPIFNKAYQTTQTVLNFAEWYKDFISSKLQQVNNQNSNTNEKK
jgi:hypothetical protein